MHRLFDRDNGRSAARIARHQGRVQQEAAAKKAAADKRQHDRYMADRRAEEMARQHAAGVTHYTQLIMALGYGGLFTLWIQTRGEMSGWMWASTGSLITFSLMVFIGFELAKAFAQDSPPQREGLSLLARVIKWWRLCFVLAAGSGLLAGGSILGWFVYRSWMEAAGYLAQV